MAGATVGITYKFPQRGFKPAPDVDVYKRQVLGFSDFQIARFVLKASGNMEKENLAVRARRKALNILPAVKRINKMCIRARPY